MEPQWCVDYALLPARLCLGIAIHFKEWQWSWEAISSPLSTVTAARTSALRIAPGQVEWEEPSARVHRAVNVGRQPYEQVTVFLLDRPDAVAQPTEEQVSSLNNPRGAI